MRAKLIKVINDVSASYWFVPMCMVLGAMLLGLTLGRLDTGNTFDWLPWEIRASVDDARTLLSVVATSVLGVAGVTFSITIVAVSFASSNYGPRLINNFMADKGSQYTLGTFIGTFVYCLTVLTNLHGSFTASSGKEVEAFVPNLSISVAMLLTFACISVLIFFIHHITETINIENIVAAIGHKLERRVTDLFPGKETHIPLVDEKDFESATPGKTKHAVIANSIGYVQTIDMKQLSTLAEEQDLLISVHYRPGDFTTTHDALLSVWTTAKTEIPHDALRQCFATGEERTEHQNVLFLAEQLSEVIARALSPGINDPFSAISCMNWFRTTLMEYLHQVKSISADTDGDTVAVEWHRARIQLAPIDLSRLCCVMFDQTRQYVAADRNTTLHTMTLIAECARFAGPGPDRDLLRQHLVKLYQASKNLLSATQESQDITRHYENLLAGLD